MHLKFDSTLQIRRSGVRQVQSNDENTRSGLAMTDSDGQKGRRSESGGQGASAYAAETVNAVDSLRAKWGAELACLNSPGAEARFDTAMDPSVKLRSPVIAGPTY